jgi:threonine/homoserine/homoserine lactone efflux protein
MVDGQFVAFLGVAVLLTVTPGADMALLTRHALLRGRAAAMHAAYGIVTGLVVWAMLATAGLAALLTASATAFTVLKVVGGAYLVYLGLQTLWQARGVAAGEAAERAGQALTPLTPILAYRQGLLSNLLNPKVGVFYTTFLPQFVSPDGPAVPQLAFLAAVHIVMGLAWLITYVRLVMRAGDVLRRPQVRLWLERTTGAVLVGLGLRLATSPR